MDLVEIAPAYDVNDNNSYNGGITSGLGQRLVIELLSGLSLTKRGLEGGVPETLRKLTFTIITNDIDNKSILVTTPIPINQYFLHEQKSSAWGQ